MKILNTILDDLKDGENIDVYLIILISAIVVVVDLLGVVQQEIVSATVLLTLGLLSFGALSTRKILKKLDQSIELINTRKSAESFIKDRSNYVSFDKTISDTHNIYMIGPTLVNIIPPWTYYLRNEKLIKQGANIRIVVIDPDSQAAEIAANCMIIAPDKFSRDVKNTLSSIQEIIENGVGSGSVEIKAMQVSPNFSMILLDPEEHHGKIFVEFVGYRSPLHKRPHIELTKYQDGEWYEYFYLTFQNLWKDSDMRLSSASNTNAANDTT